MATVTPNFNWPVPVSTDLVKDGATAIEALGDSIDATMVDLKGGTTGQVLAKASNTDMDFSWVAQDDSNAIQNTIVDAKGDLIAATAADTPARLAVGTNGQVLTADSTAATGLAWATASGGSTNVAGKNGVLNSQFNVWQRGTSLSGSTQGVYTADMWSIGGTRSWAVSRQATGDTTNLPFIQYCARVQRPNGDTSGVSLTIVQSWETVNTIPFAGKTVTMSFYARRGANFSATSNALTAQLYTGTGTDQSAWGTYTGATVALSTTATLTTTWQRFTVSGTLAATATEMTPQFGYTPTGTAGAADFFEITGVQIEVTGSASAYSPNTSTYAAELAACQRYYYRSANDGAYATFAIGAAETTTLTTVNVFVPTQMRVAPTSVTWSDLRTSDLANDYGVPSAITFNSFRNNRNVPVVNVTDTGYTAYRPMTLDANNNANAFIAFSAEL